MIVKSKDSNHREFKGVNFEVLAVGKDAMLTKMNFKKGQIVPLHSHPNEQCGYVISGKHRITIVNEETILNCGDSYSIPKNVNHSWEVLEEGVIIDFFTPPRADYS